jgi:hypothetical protein
MVVGDHELDAPVTRIGAGKVDCRLRSEETGGRAISKS